jgi:hypothetical protein
MTPGAGVTCVYDEVLADLWAKVLRAPSAGTSNFFDLEAILSWPTAPDRRMLAPIFRFRWFFRNDDRC